LGAFTFSEKDRYERAAEKQLPIEAQNLRSHKNIKDRQ
jgi:hypothetical protein